MRFPNPKPKAVHNFGAGDLIEVAGANGATELVPFNTLTIREIDVANGRIVIDPPRNEDKP